MSDSPASLSIPVALLTDAAMSKRSSLYQWMVMNHDTFAAVLKQAGRPNWDALAKTFADQGLRDADNQAPSEECTRQTWWKVRKAIKARRDRLPDAKRAVLPPQTLPTARPPPPSPSTTETPDGQHNDKRGSAFQWDPSPGEGDKSRWTGRKDR